MNKKGETRWSFLFRPEEGTSAAGKLMGSLRGPVRTCCSPCLAPLWPEASRPHVQVARWRTCRRRRPSGGLRLGRGALAGEAE